MIVRWYVDMQEYDYTLEDILGSDNPVADGFSRLVPNNMTPGQVAALLPMEEIPHEVYILIGTVHNSVSGHHGVKRTLRTLTSPQSKNSAQVIIREKVPYLRTHVKDTSSDAHVVRK